MILAEACSVSLQSITIESSAASFILSFEGIRLNFEQRKFETTNAIMLMCVRLHRMALL